MTILEQIKADSLSARKARESKASLLTTMVSELEAPDSKGNRGSDDNQTTVYLKKLLKSVEDTLTLNVSDETRTKLEMEKEIISQYIPEQMPEHKLTEVIRGIINNIPEENRTPRAMGVVMSELKTNYGTTYNGAMASKIVKEELQ